MNNKKINTKNINVKWRLGLASAAAVMLSFLFLIVFLLHSKSFLPSIYNFASVTSTQFSSLNQVQWNQETDNLLDCIRENSTDEARKESLKKSTSDYEQMGTKLCIIKNDELYYSNTTLEEITKEVGQISSNSLENSLSFYSNNGLVIIHSMMDKGDKYKVVISNTNYTIASSNDEKSQLTLDTFVLGRTALIILLILLVFILSIVMLSLIVSGTITKPIQMLADGANEIASGNLDYKIDYDSTNEIGVTVKAMNEMTAKLKGSIEERERIEQSRKEMVAGLAHDLRTPLTSIKGYVEGLRDGIASTPEKHSEYIQTIYSSALDMEKLLDELLNISRLELGKIQLDKQKIDLLTFLDEYVEETSASLDNEEITFSYLPPENKTPVSVLLDADRFSRVLNNIISNSKKYSKPNEKCEIMLSVSVYEKSVIISVKDNGIGIEDKNIQHIFDTFYRADVARTKTSDGSGIGLAICKEIVNLHGGQIWATSKVNEGTTIVISLQKQMED